MIYKVSQKKTDLAKQVGCYENYGQNMLSFGTPIIKRGKVVWMNLHNNRLTLGENQINLLSM